MKYAVIYGPRDLRVEDRAIPSVGPEDILVRVRACGICGSDLHRYKGDRFGLRLAPYPLNSGHEFCGDVTNTGSNVKRFKVGDKVTLGLNWVRDGIGAFSEYLRIPDANQRPIYKVPDAISYEEAAQIEPLTVALGGFYGPTPEVGETVLILGAGPIGLSLLQRCKIEGVKEVVVSEISPKRLELARSFGALAVDPTKESLEEQVKTVAKDGVDVVFECAGAALTTKQALSLTKRRGRVMIIAHYGQSTAVDPEEIVSRSLTVLGFGALAQGSRGKGGVEEASRLILEGKMKLKPLISHEFPLEKAKDAFEAAMRPDISVKVLIKP